MPNDPGSWLDPYLTEDEDPTEPINRAELDALLVAEAVKRERETAKECPCGILRAQCDYHRSPPEEIEEYDPMRVYEEGDKVRNTAGIWVKSGGGWKAWRE